MASSITGSMVDGRTSRTDRPQLEATPICASKVDTRLVDQAVRDLNAIYTSRALETACVIGDYVIDHFFGGRIGKFAILGDRHASFRALAKHRDLRFSATYLWTAVAVVGQLRELPEDVGSRLPLSHHRLLLPLKDTSTKKSLAKKALRQHLSKRELAGEIGRLRERGVLRSNKRASRPEVLKAMSQLVEASEDFVRIATAGDTIVGKSTPGRVNSLLARLELDLDAVRCTVAMMRSRIQVGREPDSGLPYASTDELSEGVGRIRSDD